MKYNKVIKLLVILILLVFASLQVSISIAKDPKKVAILPFNMNADRDLTFLQEGIMDMLASRLAWKGEVEILEKGLVKKKAAKFKGPLNKEQAILIGKALQVDYVIIGSLTVFGESTSIDAMILDVIKAEELVTAFNQSRGMDEVIPTVNQFAQDINEKIMGRVIRPTVSARAPEVRRGPGGLIGDMESFEEKAPGYVQRFNVQITGLDVGDVDGDGKNELVLVDRDTVYVYKWVNRSFKQSSAIKGRWGPNYVYVSVGDMDHDGTAEIYVSNPSGDGISSLVLEWDGSGFKKIAGGQLWFFRVIDIPGKGKTLIGQKRGVVGSFRGGVQFLKREGNRFVSTGPVDLHRFGNVFNFAFMDLGEAGNRHTIMYGPSEYLRLFSPQGEEIWISDDSFGGTYTYMSYMRNTQEERIYFSSPVQITDVDEDGEEEVMVCRNYSPAGRFLEKVRLFTSGTLYFMTWDHVGLGMKWKSKKQPGPIVGYRVVDVDNDGLEELVIASVKKQAIMFRNPRSQVVVYDLK